ncbi:hypothetical protein NUW58_g9746 [Xylaria curta]|uniref:Uncharacterized protein n=1 Tax=Xylaria curta TaxID=42375 RepID=A0ACC1MTG8_9PEZI|nr:hypothetical protein NUW58_g9746 [Xylaria curta]
MEHSMEHNMEPLMEFHSNLPEMLAVDLEQSSNIFQSKQLTAGAPAPGLADDGDRRRYSLPHNPRYLTPLLLSQQDGVLSNSKSLQTIHQKYSDIFAPLDYHTPKRDSVSSSDSSVDLEPRSISTQDESILTVDTWLESDKHTIPILLHISPTSEYASPLSWINLDGDDEGFSPITQRRRSSMTDFPKYMQQFKSSNETSVETMPSSPRKAVASEASTKLVNEAPPSIPQRRSSLQHEGEMGHNARHSIELWQPNEEPVLTFENSAGPSFLEDEADFTFRNSTSTSPQNDSAFVTPNEYTPINPRTSGESIGLVIASSEVSFEEWLESDRKYFPCREELVALRPIPHEVCELLRSIVKTFPEPLLQCDSQLADTVCKLSREAPSEPPTIEARVEKARSLDECDGATNPA